MTKNHTAHIRPNGLRSGKILLLQTIKRRKYKGGEGCTFEGAWPHTRTATPAPYSYPRPHLYTHHHHYAYTNSLTYTPTPTHGHTHSYAYAPPAHLCYSSSLWTHAWIYCTPSMQRSLTHVWTHGWRHRVACDIEVGRRREVVSSRTLTPQQRLRERGGFYTHTYIIALSRIPHPFPHPHPHFHISHI